MTHISLQKRKLSFKTNLFYHIWAEVTRGEGEKNILNRTLKEEFKNQLIAKVRIICYTDIVKDDRPVRLVNKQAIAEGEKLCLIQ